MKVPRSDLSKYHIAIDNLRSAFKCVICSGPLENQPIEDAWETNTEHAWLYIECPKCNFQNALWKILSRIKVKR